MSKRLKGSRSARLLRLLLLAGVPLASAQAAGLLTPSIPGVVNANTRIDLINAGFAGSEGSLGLPDGSLLFAETKAGRITRVAPDGGLSTALEDTEGASALAWHPHGELIAAQGAQGSVAVVFPPQRKRVLADKFDGHRIGAVNDLVLDQLGNVYFAATASEGREGGVFRVAYDGRLTRVSPGQPVPKGVQLSPDERTLFITSDRADGQGAQVLAYTVADNGQVGPARAFAALQSPAGGLAVDARGRLYAASGAGIAVFSPKGESLGLIELPQVPQNLAFAGQGKRTLYALGGGVVYRIVMTASGYAGRAK